VKEKYSLPDRYFFFLGNTDPKKNTKGTLKAYSEFHKQTGSDIRLVMIDYDKAELHKILEEIGDLFLEDQIFLPDMYLIPICLLFTVNAKFSSILPCGKVLVFPCLKPWLAVSR